MLAKDVEAQSRIAEGARTSDRNVVMDAMSEIMTTDLRPDMADITMPVSVFYAHDPRMGISATRDDALYAAAYAKLPDASPTQIDGSFHFIMDDQPDVFIDMVSTHLVQLTKN